MKGTILIIFIFVCVFDPFKNQPLFSQVVNYSYSDAKRFNDELYKNCPQYQGKEYVKLSYDLLKQIEIVKVDMQEASGYPLLSEVLLMDKCNPELAYDNNTEKFSIKDFNPLKYFLPIGSFFRIDGTNYLVRKTK
ncbi:MAG: hypothetical protein J0G96_06555 [Flavobacteriia bacterium]|nr:hypothetical protein [Flavobacteriia bacterium]